MSTRLRFSTSGISARSDAGAYRSALYGLAARAGSRATRSGVPASVFPATTVKLPDDDVLSNVMPATATTSSAGWAASLVGGGGAAEACGEDAMARVGVAARAKRGD